MRIHFLVLLIVCAVTANKKCDHENGKKERFPDIANIQDWLSKSLGSKKLNLFQIFFPMSKTDHNINAQVVMLCMNRQHKTAKQFIQKVNPKKPNNIKKNDKIIDNTLPVAILIHGWGYTDSSWMEKTATEYIKHIDTNVCMIYWEKLARNTDLFEVADCAIPHVVNRIEGFIKVLKEKSKISLDDISIVGHGLGAHIAGFVGKRFNGKIGEIYALDPFGILYTEPSNEFPQHRLDANDAKYVQVIYTSSNALGSEAKLGDHNFRPNLGRYPQVPCFKQKFSFKCSHQIATDYFRYSLNPKNEFIGRHCSSNITKYLLNQCGKENYNSMGVHANKKEEGGFYYVEPSIDPPYVPMSIL